VPRFVFLTRTPWDELPRIRHQLARLLAGAGHEVLYFEPGAAAGEARRAEPGISVLAHRRRDRLPWLPGFHAFNARTVKRSLAPALERHGVGGGDTVVNFVFDYWFLRQLFPGNRIVTMINDDFVSSARFGWRRPYLWALRRTCELSDRVLTVSVPLQRQLAPFCRPELFLPWADQAYREPAPGAARDTLLFWGYINWKLDWPFVERLADSQPSMRLLFVGPVDAEAPEAMRRVRQKRNVEFAAVARLDELPLDRILAGLIPYRPGVPDLDAITLPNKALQLLARGIPLLISGMPDFIRAPFVVRADADADGVLYLRENHAALQPAIREFVARNGPAQRLAQLLGTAAS
jgi:hypothetical protein